MDPGTMAALYGGQALAGGLSTKLQKKGRWNQLSTMAPDQIGNAQWAGQQGRNQIENPYQGFEPIANQAVNRFQQQTVPGLAERFTSMGTGTGQNATSSPAFASQLGQAGAGLSSDIAALQSQYGLENQRLGQGLLGYGQASRFENEFQQPEPTFLSGLFGGLSGGAGSLFNAGLQKRYGGNKMGNLGGMGGGGNNDQTSALISQLTQALQQIQAGYGSGGYSALQGRQRQQPQNYFGGSDYYSEPYHPSIGSSNLQKALLAGRF